MAAIKDKVEFEHIASFLQTESADKRIIISDETETGGHISRARVEAIRDEQSGFLEIVLGKFYERPLTLTDASTISYVIAIVQRRAGYQVVQEVFRGQDDIPEYVQRWIDEANSLVDMVTTGAHILPGEELIGSGEPTTADYTDRAERRPIVRSSARVFHNDIVGRYGEHR